MGKCTRFEICILLSPCEHIKLYDFSPQTSANVAFGPLFFPHLAQRGSFHILVCWVIEFSSLNYFRPTSCSLDSMESRNPALRTAATCSRRSLFSATIRLFLLCQGINFNNILQTLPCKRSFSLALPASGWL